MFSLMIVHLMLFIYLFRKQDVILNYLRICKFRFSEKKTYRGEVDQLLKIVFTDFYICICTFSFRDTWCY